VGRTTQNNTRRKLKNKKKQKKTKNNKNTASKTHDCNKVVKDLPICNHNQELAEFDRLMKCHKIKAKG
jgi:hypothetical protein